MPSTLAVPSFRVNGVSIVRLAERDGKSRYRLMPPADYPGMRHLDFSIDWAEAPDDSKVLEVIDYAARRAVRSVRDEEPRWLAAYCGTP